MGSPGGYGRLLRAAYRTVKAQDRGGRVVLAGITQRASEELDDMYARGGIKGLFDVAALQIFPHTVKRSVEATRLFRRALRRRGDRAIPIYLIEPLGRPPKDTRAEVSTCPRDQAQHGDQAGPGLWRAGPRRRALGLARVYWFTRPRPTAAAEASSTTPGCRPQRRTFVAQPALGDFGRKARQFQGCPKTARGVCK